MTDDQLAFLDPSKRFSPGAQAPSRRLRDHQHDLGPGVQALTSADRLRDYQGRNQRDHQGARDAVSSQRYPRERGGTRPFLDRPANH